MLCLPDLTWALCDFRSREHSLEVSDPSSDPLDSILGAAGWAHRWKSLIAQLLQAEGDRGDYQSFVLGMSVAKGKHVLSNSGGHFYVETCCQFLN